MKATILPLVLAAAFCLNCVLSAERPNIVLVMCDDLGWSDVGFNGGQIIRTPHLDQMAREGLRFSQFYNTAKCHSSRVSLLTGKRGDGLCPVRLAHPQHCGGQTVKTYSLTQDLARSGNRTYF